MRPCWLPVQTSTSSAEAVDPGARDPGRPGLAVGRVPARRRVVEQAPRVPARGEEGERGQERGALGLRRGVRRVVLPEVHEPLGPFLLAFGVAGTAHECPTPHLAARRARAAPPRRRHGSPCRP